MRRAILLVVALGLTTGAAAPWYPQKQDFDIQAHRGGLGLRVENTLASFGNALKLGVNWQVHDPAQTVAPHEDWYLRQNPAYFHGPTVEVLQERYGLKVVPYTVNDPAVMDRVIRLGVDGIISDDPITLINVAIRHGLR